MFKVSIGIAVVVITCAIGVSASVASAATFHSESASTDYRFDDLGIQTIELEIGNIECAEFSASGEVLGSKTSETLTVGGAGAGWTECEAFGLAAQEFESQCEFVLRSEHMLTIQSSPGGNCSSVPLTFKVPGCTVKIGPQTVTKVEYANEGAGANRTIDADLQITNLGYNWSGVLCGSGSKTNGIYEGFISITGKDVITEKQTGIWWE